MGVDRIGEAGDRTSEGQAAGLCWAGLTVGSLARNVARGETRRMGKKVSSDKKLTGWEDGRRY